VNPYARFLGDRDPLVVIAATPGELARRGEPAKTTGRWSAREIVCHLADTEMVFAFRIRQALAEEHYVIQPFDQDRWAERYGAYDFATALELFGAARRWNLLLLRSVAPAEYDKLLTHPERGEMTFRTLVETMAGHDLNHLSQMA
jgi:hypothetical protein